MKSIVVRFARGLAFAVYLLTFVISAPLAQAGLTFYLQLQRFNIGTDYYYGCGAYFGTNTDAPQLSPGTYRLESPLQPTNGFNSGYILTTNGDFNGTGGGGSLYSDDNFPEYINNITNGLWSIYVTNTVTTNVYRFRVTAAINSNTIPRVTITYPTNDATQISDQPTFQWQGPTPWAGDIYVVTTYFTNGDYTFLNEDFLSGSATNWIYPGTLPATTNQILVQYNSNSPPALTCTTPTNGAGQVVSGWILNSFLISYATSDFTVNTNTNLGSGHTNLAHYNFENNSIFAQDVSGNGNNINSAGSFGSATGFTTNDSFAGGSYAMAYNGNGNGVGYFLAPPTNLLSTLARSFSLSLWVKTTQISGSDTDNGFANVGIATAFQGAKWIQPMVLTGSKVAFLTGGSPNHLLRSSASINTGSYVHLVVTRNQATGEKKIYINGTLDATGTGTGTTDVLDDITQFRLGAGGSYGLNGRMDEVQFYSGVLNATEVAYLYNNPSSTVSNTSGGGGGPLTLAEAVDTTNLVWATGGYANWTPQTATTHDTVDAARSGALNVGGFNSTYIQTTVTGPGTLTFWWRNVLNDSDFYTQFYIDGSYQNDIYGPSGWSQDPPYNIGAGTHTLRWESFDDGTVDANAAGYLDQVVFTPVAPNPPPVITVQPFSQTNRPAYQVALLADSTNATAWQWHKVGSGPISGATTNFFIPTNSGTAGVAGNYFAVATNSGGASTTLTATVTFVSATVPPNWSTAFKSFLLGGNNGERRTNYGICFLLDSSGTNLYSANSYTGTNTFASDTLISGPGRFGTALMKQTTNGTSLWARGITNTGNGNSYPQSIAPAPGGGVYLSGVFSGTNGLGTNALIETAGGTTWLARFDTNGNVLWIRTVNSVSGTNANFQSYHQLVADPAGNVTISSLINNTVTVGTTNVTAPGQKGLLAQFDANGNLRWAQVLSGWATYLTYSGGCIYGSLGGNATNFIGGITNTSDRQWALFAMNATNGQTIWLRNIASAQGQYAPADQPAVAVSGTNVFVTGTAAGSNAVFGAFSVSWPDNLRQYFARYDTNGTAQLATTYGSATLFPWAAVADASGNVYVGGDFDTYATFGSNIVAAYHKDGIGGSSPSQTFIAKFDRNGNSLWARTAQSPNYYVNLRDVALASDGIWTYGFVLQSANFGSFQVFGTTFIISSELQYLVGGAFGKITDAAVAGPNPITLLSPTNSAAQFQFSFNSQSGFTHSVIYRTNLAVGTWQTYSNVTGDDSLKTIPIPASVFGGSKHAFVRVQTQ